MFLASCLYAIAFVGNVFVANSLDAAPRSPLGHAVAVDLALLALFAGRKISDAL